MPRPAPPTRLVIDGRRLTAGRTGVGRYLEVLLGGWAESGLPLPEGRLVLSESSLTERLPSIPGLSVEVAGAGLPGLVWEVLALRRRLGPGDLLLAPANLTPPLWRGPTLLVLHDTLMAARPADFGRSARWRLAWRYKRSARGADRVVVPSAATGVEAVRWYGVDPARLRVIPPAVDPAFRPGPASPRPYFLFVGKPSARRNLGAIVDGFARARPRVPDHRLILAGPGVDGGRFAGDGVEALGYVAEADLPGLYAGATALIYPSEAEGFGLPVAEAMAAGCPVAVLRGGAPAEVAGDAAFYLDSPDAGAIAAAMVALATDASRRGSLVAAGLRRAVAFDRGRLCEQFSEAVRELAYGPPAVLASPPTTHR